MSTSAQLTDVVADMRMECRPSNINRFNSFVIGSLFANLYSACLLYTSCDSGRDGERREDLARDQDDGAEQSPVAEVH